MGHDHTMNTADSLDHEIRQLENLVKFLKTKQEHLMNADIAYKHQNFTLENQYDKKARKNDDDIAEIRKYLADKYKPLIETLKLAPEDATICYMSIDAEGFWYQHPYIREISKYEHGKQELIYFKIDGSDGKKTHQLKMYTGKYFAREMLEALQKVLS